MDWKLILCIACICICTVFFVIRTKKIVEFAVKCRREGVKKVKVRVNIGVFLCAALTAWFLWLTVNYFCKANEMREAAEYAESKIGTEYVDKFIEKQELKKQIKIYNPEQYFLDFIGNVRALSAEAAGWGVFFLIMSIDGILTLIGFIEVITSKGYRHSGINDALPIFAEYDRQNSKIIVNVKDLYGVAQKVFTFNANPKNLASLGEFIEWEPETQEEIQ